MRPGQIKVTWEISVTHSTDGWLSFQAGCSYFQLPREAAERLYAQLGAKLNEGR